VSDSPVLPDQARPTSLVRYCGSPFFRMTMAVRPVTHAASSR
jgi:hypothetical protein